MRKRVFGRQLKRTTKQRKALFRSLIRSLVLYGRIKTTEAKAKAIQGKAEKAVTLAKHKGELVQVRLSKDYTSDIVNKIINDIAPKFKERPGGYTRIVKIGSRIKDNAPMVILEWVEQVEVQRSKLKIKSGKKRQSVEKDKTKKEEKSIKERSNKEGKNAKDNKTNKRK